MCKTQEEKIMSKFLATDIVDNEGEGLLQVLVYPLPDGEVKVAEPTDIRPDVWEGICSVERCLSNRQKYRLHTNLRKLFEVVDSSVSFLTLSPLIYEAPLDEKSVLDAIITDEEKEDEENPPLIWEEDDEEDEVDED
jgi:hypothetical protein